VKDPRDPQNPTDGLVKELEEQARRNREMVNLAGAFSLAPSLSEQSEIISNALKATAFPTQIIADAISPSSLAEELQRAMRNESIVSSRLTESLAALPTIPAASFEPPEFLYQSRDLVLPDIPPDPGFETNEHLEQLSAHMQTLVDVAKHQTELTQAIRETTQATLQYAIQAGNEAKESTSLSRAGIELTRLSAALTRRSVHIAIGALIVAVISTIVSMVTPIYLDRHSSAAHDLTEERELRAKELLVLNDISARLAAQQKAITTSKPSTKTK
jgi:hypothetical protein